MYPAIISVGPGAGNSNSNVTNTVEKVWLKFNQFLYAFALDPASKTYRYPATLNKNEVAVIWAEVDDKDATKFTIIRKETKDFSYSNLERITQSFLARYNPGSNPDSKGNPGIDADDGKTGNPGIDAGNKEGAKNDHQGKGGDLGFSSWGGAWNLPDWLKNLGPWFWLACAGAGALWFFSTDGKKVIIRIVSGGVTVFCTVNYLQRANLPFKIPFIGQLPEPPKKRLIL